MTLTTATAPAPVAPAPVERRRRHRRALPVGWPFYAMFYGYPLWWLLGLQAFIWPILALPMLVQLVMRRRVVVPRGFGIWLAFLLWMFASAVQLDSPHRYLSFAYRGSLYLSAAVVLIYVFNLAKQVPVRRLVLPLAFLYIIVVLGGFAAFPLRHVSFSTPVQVLLPGSIAGNPFIYSLVHNQFAQDTVLLGFQVPRPQAPFNYTNEWGSNLAILTPLAVYAVSYVRRRLWRVVLLVTLAVSVIPIIVSINRGLWLSLSVAILYVVFRLGFRGHVRLLAGTVCALAVLAGVVVFTPLGGVVAARFHHSNTSARASLYQQATDSVLASPVLGHGAPLQSEETTSGKTGPSVGTHGQMWTLLVSQGFPGTALFVGFFLAMWLATWRVSTRGLWPHAAILATLVQLPYYNVLPAQIFLLAVAIVLCWQDVLGRALLTAEAVRRPRRRPSTRAGWLPSPDPAEQSAG